MKGEQNKEKMRKNRKIKKNKNEKKCKEEKNIFLKKRKKSKK